MMKAVRFTLSCFMLSAVLIAGEPLTVDSSQTKVDFTLPSLLHTVHGEFRLKRGALNFDPQTGALSGELVVDATSGESGNGSRDKRMHNAILESAKYPEITFRPDRVDGKVVASGKSQVRVHGMFTIHGAEHEVMAPASVDASNGVYMVELKLEVPYVKWGMKNPSTLMLRVNDTVTIDVRTRIATASARSAL